MTAKRKGFTVLEVMLSITVLTLFATAIFPTIGWLINRSARLAADNQAAWLLQEGMEISYNVFLGNWDGGWTQFPEGVYHPAVEVAGGDQVWTLLPGDQVNVEAKYGRAIEISRVCRSLSTGERVDQPCTAEAPEDEFSRLVRTVVSWEDRGTARQVEAELLLTRLSL